MKILIYSFEKFREGFYDLKSNPAYEVGKELRNKFSNGNADLIQLPVTYDCWEILKNKIDEFKPDFVLGLGIAIELNKVRVEKIGLNYKHSEMPDNSGTKFADEKIIPSGELSFETTIDVLSFVNTLKNDGVPAEISFHTGTYICNYTYYSCLNYLFNKETKVLFIHVPASPKEVIELNADVASLPTGLIAEGIYQAVNEMQLR